MGGLTVNVAVFWTVPSVAVIVEVVTAATAVVVIWNVTELAPAGTVTEVGIPVTVLDAVSVTTFPLEPAAPVRVTVPVAVRPPSTVVGEMETLLSDEGVMVSGAVCASVP